MVILLVQETLLRAVRNFLKQHNIDPGEFDSQFATIMSSTYKNYNAGNVSGTGTVIDERSAATDSGNVDVPRESEPEAKE
jgi:hypothetical protein